MKSWVLVADGSRARLFVLEKNHSLREMESFVCPEDRLQEQDLSSDRPGRSFDSRGGGRHGMEPGTRQREASAIRFAGDLAGRLENLRRAGDAEKFILIAAPAFLGHLRSKLSEPLKNRVALTIDKDLTQQEPARIIEHIPRFF